VLLFLHVFTADEIMMVVLLSEEVRGFSKVPFKQLKVTHTAPWSHRQHM